MDEERIVGNNLKRDVLIAVAILGLGFTGLAYAPKVKKEYAEEEVEILPLNGVFYCEYYKSKRLVLEDIHSYEVVATQAGWNWLFEMQDGTAIFYTQTQGQLCYVHHVGEEEWQEVEV